MTRLFQEWRHSLRFNLNAGMVSNKRGRRGVRRRQGSYSQRARDVFAVCAHGQYERGCVCWFLPQPLRERNHVWRRRNSELVVQQARVRRAVLQRTRAIASFFERLHNEQSDTGVERVVRGALRPPLDGSGKIMIVFRRLGEAFQLLRELSREARTLTLEPALEFHSLAQIEAVEERASVQSDSV
jgi:hypothetical protein